MRILQILPAMHVGGVETGTLDMARELVRRGHQAYVVSTGGDLVPELVKAGVRHITLPVKKKSIWSLRTVPELRRIIEWEQIDIVHARSRLPALLAYWATRGTRAVFVTTCHGFYSHHSLSKVMGWGRRVIVTSTVIGRRMVDVFGVDPARVTLVHRGVDISRFTFDAGHYAGARKNGKFVMGYVGRLSPIKGIDDFIKAVYLLSRKHVDLEAWIAGGEDGRKRAYLPYLQAVVKKLELSNVVRFLGVRRDIPELVKQMDAVILPTKIPESFGRVLVEAGASGTAVIATKIGGALDIIDHEENGLLVSPGSPTQIAGAVECLMKEPELAARLARHMRAKVERVFSLEKMADETIRVYQKAIEDRRFLILKLGALGDVVLAVPSFRMLRKRFPGAYLALLIDRRFYEIVKRCPYLDEVIPVDREEGWKTSAGFMKTVRRVRRGGFEVSVDLQNTYKTHLLAFWAGISSRAGYRRGWSERFINQGAGRFDDKLPPVTHQFRVLEKVSVRDFDDELELWPDEDDRKFVRQLLDAEWAGPHQKLIGFVLGASRRWVTKQWPIEYYAALAERLTSERDVRIVLMGDGADQDLAEDFKSRTSVRPIDLTGRTSLGQLVALVEQLEVLVSGDSAPIHIATAVKTPVVALFGPTDPRRHAPPGYGNQIFFKQVHCSPCYQTRCSVGHICMHRISVDEVFEAVKDRMLYKEKMRRTEPPVYLGHKCHT